MFSFLSITLLPCLLGALLVLLLILKKGDICPGQRGRIFKQVLTLGGLWLVSGLTFWPAAIVGLLLLTFFSRVKTGKTRDEGPVVLLYLAAIFGFGCVIYLGANMGWLFSLYILFCFLLLGAWLAHVLLIQARTRLQAFHFVLPVAGIIAAMGVAVVVLLKGAQLEPQMLTILMNSILVNLVALLVGLSLWIWHLFSQKTVTLWLPLAGFLIGFVSVTNLVLLIGV
ncbi:MAG: hypothetical protein ACPHV3_07310 [Vibrio sp.]